MPVASSARRIVPLVAASVTFLVGIALGAWIRTPAPVFAATTSADDTFAACTAPIGEGMEGLFLLDFETGDLTGGVLNRTTAKFTTAYRHNVLQDLEFKAGKVKNPRFLLTAGFAEFAGNAAMNMAGSVLYVTDAASGVTVAYAIPWNAQQAASGPPVAALIPLDKARPRGLKVP